MAKGIFNHPYIQRSGTFEKDLMADHIKKCLAVEDYLNGSTKVLKMDKCQASFLRGIYEALSLLSEIYITLKNQGGDVTLITNLLGDEFFADYIVDHYAFKQKLFPTTYKDVYAQAEKEDDLYETYN